MISLSFAQVSNLLEYETRVSKKIEVGMSGEEVKKKIGRPKAVESGFPNTQEKVILELPEQVGQLNYSTWFYFFDKITAIIPKTIDEQFFINGIEVSEEVYIYYKDFQEIYLFDGNIIFPDAKDYYRKKDSTRFVVQPRRATDTHYLMARVVNEKKEVIPILCILFDRGTQVVASTKFLFQLIQ
jgi:hypothetical protein